MRFWRGAALCTLPVLTAAGMYLSAQEPATAGAGTAKGGGASAAAIAGSKEDPAAVERGGKLFVTNCGGCHGQTARGGPGAPDLIRSILVLDDEKGILISPVIRNGRPDQGMPPSSLPDAQVADIVAWLHVQTYAAGHRNTYAFQDVLTGDAKRGEAYFKGAGTCATCHSPTGDLKGIGSRYDGFSLQARWLNPRGGGRGGRGGGPSAKAAITVTVTPPNGPAVSGRLDRIDDFSVSLHDGAGEYHSFTREGAVPKVVVTDPLKAHTELLGKYADANIHDLTAYLVTLK
jgi:cytochrome c oxidase cbb3-type subunit III